MEKNLDMLIPKSPGMKYKHYSPKAELVVVEGELSNVVEKINALVEEYKKKGAICWSAVQQSKLKVCTMELW